ncbi:hypothetical protein M427DRAFT_37801 [Gonapodya prolifera JEL478]|uniref:RTA1-domain-containing protein n=1 Tax=Gonapodya prolifera (strain JEL478) TaxID=1344416 RepID=A0A139A0A6_GONPJ|nr:hypothetical protein M427DRAFT_37801 [Gonapodya prolifera JEL478]|eukprot:KXS10154.1 hypothetical protein M427DRAFT_37801 [Gonapodya prolifera JEL478]
MSYDPASLPPFPGGAIPWEYTQFGYNPSLALAGAAIALFGALALVHAYLARTCNASFMYPVVVGCLLEVIGFGLRIAAKDTEMDNPDNNPLFASMFAFIIIAPIFFAASVYMLLSRIVAFIGPSYSPVRPSLIASTFVTCDVAAFAVQVAFAILVMTTRNPDLLEIGRKGLIAGLFIQVVSVLVFLALSGLVFVRAREVKGAWKLVMWNQLVLSGLILARNAFRVAEFWEGFYNHISRTEWYLYVFDAGLMLLLVLAFAAVHPGAILTLPSASESGEGAGAGGKDKELELENGHETGNGNGNGNGNGRDKDGGNNMEEAPLAKQGAEAA